MLHDLRYVEALPRTRSARDVLAALLRAASALLDRLARALTHEPEPVRGEPMLEFYAEAGAPEGALYLDGVLVGTVEGVRRL
jgi:hypothetical protein